jgi:hypothetical protein
MTLEEYTKVPVCKITIFDDAQRIGIGAKLPEEW